MVDLSKTIRIEPRRVAATGARGKMDLDLLDLTPPAEVRTELIDWSSARELHAQLLELCAADRLEPAPRTAETQRIPPAAEPASNLGQTLVLAPERQPAPNLGETLVMTPSNAEQPKLGDTLVLTPRPRALDSTIYDGGALRDYASKLAAAEASPSAKAPETNAAAVTHATDARFSALRARCARLVHSRTFAEVKAWWRATPRSKKLLLALLGVALVLAAAGKLPLGPRHATSVAPPEPTAPLRSQPPTAAAATSAARPPGAAAPRDSPDAPASAAPPSGGASAPADPALERAALRAAFDGNKRDAIAAYERLSATAGGEQFKLAARLLREDHVRKP